MSEEFIKKMEEYSAVLNDDFPTIPLLYKGEERCIEMIDQCIAAKKNVEEMGFYFHDMDIKY